MRSSFKGLLRKEVYHILRDRRTLYVLIGMPILQVVLFGYAIRTDVKHVRLVVVDPSPDYATLELRERLAAADVFRIVTVVQHPMDLEKMFASGEAQQAIVFPANFAEELARGAPAQVSIVTDATEPNMGGAIQAYAINVLQQYENELRARTRSVRIKPQLQMRFNPTRESSNLFVPGLMAFVLTIISSLMTAISLTREKETGTMEVLLVSPLRPQEIILGKVAPYMVIGFITVLAVVVEARVVFNVPVRGSVVLLLSEGLLYILASLALGILISARTSSQRVAMTAALAGTMLPSIMLSGFIFPLESMPAQLQIVSNIIPAKWFVIIARGIMLKGIGLSYLWKETLVLAVMTTVLLAASMRSFKVRLT